jgi:hypothetical protein
MNKAGLYRHTLVYLQTHMEKPKAIIANSIKAKTRKESKAAGCKGLVNLLHKRHASHNTNSSMGTSIRARKLVPPTLASMSRLAQNLKKCPCTDLCYVLTERPI